MDSRWTMPDYQYTKVYKVPKSKKTLQVFFIDTPRICPEVKSTAVHMPTDPQQQRYIWQAAVQVRHFVYI